MNSCTEMSPPFPYPQGMLLKLARRAPILAWRMGLGRVLGHVLALITTTDCESGRPHRVVTRYFTYRGKLIVPCALGERSDWYRNVMTNPRATVQTWQGAEAMRAEVITEAEEIRALYPVAMRCNPGTLAAYLRSLGIDPDDIEDVIAKRARLACVVATIVLLTFAVAGRVIFKFLGLTMPAFQIAASIVLLMVAALTPRVLEPPVAAAMRLAAGRDT